MSYATDRENAELRWVFCKTFIEPHIKEASNDDSAEGLLPNHEFFLRSTAKAQCVVKCRKIAFSWCVALDALARAATEPRSTSIILSYDEDESRSKNRFISWIYGVLPNAVKAELQMTDGSESRRFKNGSEIKMLARKAPTGAGATIYCDEFSVEGSGGVSAAEILIAAIGATTHTGFIRVGGTQRGPDTLFNKIVTGQWADALGEDAGLSANDLPAMDWEIGRFPWWSSPALCHDVEGAKNMAPHMTTVERVKLFGNEKLKIQFVTYCKTPELGMDMFQREFELRVLDESECYFPTELIRSCIAPAVPKYFFVRSDMRGEEPTEKGKGVVHRVQAALRRGEIEGEMAASMDVARDHDMAVIAIGHNLMSDRTLMMLRALIVMDKVPFPAMRELWYYVLDHLPIVRGAVDATKGSVGRQLGEEAMLKYGQRSMCFEFTPSNRQIGVAAMKGRMENGGLVLPSETRDGDIEREYLSIKRKTTIAGNVIFDAQRNDDGHSDIFFSLVMMGTLFDQPEGGSPYAYQVARPEPIVLRTMPGRDAHHQFGGTHSSLPKKLSGAFGGNRPMPGRKKNPQLNPVKH